MIRRLAIAAALALLAGNTPAAAHKMKVFATAEGAAISGYAYFNSGGRAQQATVTAAGSDGAPVYEGVTDDQGQFAFLATWRMDHVISADGGDGHMASFTISAAELPDNLPAAGKVGGAAGKVGGAPMAAVPPVPALAEAAAVAAGDLRTLVDQSIARQIRPLREQLDAYQEKIWWHDVIGGIGYIVGLAGLAFGWANRKPRPPRMRRPTAVEEAAAP